MGRAKRHIPSLRRGRPSVSPKKKIWIYTEGRNTEPQYFSALARLHSRTILELEIIGGVGDPQNIANTSIDKYRSLPTGKRRDSYERRDEVWAVFDRDEHPHFYTAIASCVEAGVKVARSNPCFEVWLILHYETFDKAYDRHQTQDHFAKLHPSYSPRRSKSLQCDAFIGNVFVAEERAQRQLQARDREGNAYGLPSTTVHDLVRSIARRVKPRRKVKTKQP